VRHVDLRQSREGGAASGEIEVALSRVVEVVRTYLELRHPDQLRPARDDDSTVEFIHCTAIGSAHYRRLYRLVGERWHWKDRDLWPDARLDAHLRRAHIQVWQCLVAGETAGFFELERHDDDSIEIAYFGLAEAFIGRGLGKVMLTRAAETAWALGAARVWLHTCTLDSPHALPNYKARGFVETRTETYVAQIEDARSA
jgi:GNAT superfamily N-acetyltransferase